MISTMTPQMLTPQMVADAARVTYGILSQHPHLRAGDTHFDRAAELCLEEPERILTAITQGGVFDESEALNAFHSTYTRGLDGVAVHEGPGAYLRQLGNYLAGVQENLRRSSEGKYRQMLGYLPFYAVREGSGSSSPIRQTVDLLDFAHLNVLFNVASPPPVTSSRAWTKMLEAVYRHATYSRRDFPHFDVEPPFLGRLNPQFCQKHPMRLRFLGGMLASSYVRQGFQQLSGHTFDQSSMMFVSAAHLYSHLKKDAFSRLFASFAYEDSYAQENHGLHLEAAMLSGNALYQLNAKNAYAVDLIFFIELGFTEDDEKAGDAFRELNQTEIIAIETQVRELTDDPRLLERLERAMRRFKQPAA
ncbi:MAG: hypothetical protein HY540_03370 [Deltaproteobacteria bacterium]|nr:hypothetical protein [Deltaproteobacteria bacterium]